MSTLSVDTITGQTTAANVKMPKGHIIQLEQNTNLAVLQSNGTALTNVLSLAITPKYNTSKILVQVSGQLANSTAGQASFLYLKRIIPFIKSPNKDNLLVSNIINLFVNFE